MSIVPNPFAPAIVLNREDQNRLEALTVEDVVSVKWFAFFALFDPVRQKRSSLAHAVGAVV